MANATLHEIAEFFGYETTAEFRKEWTQVDQDGKDEIKALVGEALGK